MAEARKILIDVSHSAHVHLFKNVARLLQNSGNKILFTVRNKEDSAYLLRKYAFEHIPLGGCYAGSLGKAKGFFEFGYKILSAARKFKADLLLSHGSVNAAVASFFMRRPHISLEDTGNLEQIWLYKPFTKAILSPSCLKVNLGRNHIRYKGYHELAYLHPKYFTPDGKVLDTMKASAKDRFAIVRFTDHSPTHDRGYKGLLSDRKIECVQELSKYARVYISSENKLPRELEKFRLNIPPEKIHHALYYAALVYTEGATIASEASILGTPAVYIDCKGRDYTREQEERYGSVFNFGGTSEDQKRSILKGAELLKAPAIKEEWGKKRDDILRDTIDVTALLTWFVKKYPNSLETARVNPDYQFQAG